MPVTDGCVRVSTDGARAGVVSYSGYVTPRVVRELERRVRRPAAGVFAEGEVDGLPEPVRRLFRATIAPGTPLAPAARLRMRGEIRLKR